MSKGKRPYLLNIVKLLFSFIVAFTHLLIAYYPDNMLFFNGAYIVVDFFFILSGFFLYFSHKGGKYKNAFTYTVTRIKDFFPYLFIMLVLYNVVELTHDFRGATYTFSEAFKNIMGRIIYSISEVLCLQMVLPARPFNGPLWYISVMVVVGFILYLYLDVRKYENSCVILVISLFMLGYIYTKAGFTDVHMVKLDITTIRVGMLRGFADMGIGLFCAENFSNYKHDSKKLTLLEAGMFVFFMIVMFNFAKTDYDFVSILLSSAFITLVYGDLYLMDKIKHIPAWVDMLSKNIYYCHGLIVIVWASVRSHIAAFQNGAQYLEMAAYICVVIICSVLLEYIVRLFKTITKKISKSQG